MDNQNKLGPEKLEHVQHRGLLESYSDSAHLATYGGQSSVVDENVIAHLIWIIFISKYIKSSNNWKYQNILQYFMEANYTVDWLQWKGW